MQVSNGNKPVLDIPISLFAAVLGIAGLGHAWRRAAAVLWVAPWIGEALIFAGVFVFAWIAAAYGVKVTHAPHLLRQEVDDLKQISFFATVPLSLQLFAAGALPLDSVIATMMWAIGTVAQLVLMLIILLRWFQGGWTLRQLQPPLLLPFAGVLLGPATGFHLGFIELAWMMFSFGLLLWLLVLVLLFARLIFDMPLADGEQPLMAILVTPPALAFMSYTVLNQSVVDGFARVLFYTVVFFLMLTLAQSFRLARQRFSLAWWSFTFPAAAAASAAMEYRLATGTNFPTGLCVALLALASILVGYCSVRTMMGLSAGSLFKRVN